MFNIATPAEAKAKIQAEIEELGITEPKNLEEQLFLWLDVLYMKS